MRLLVVHHTASPTLHTMFEAVMEGATNDGIEGVEVTARAALAATTVTGFCASFHCRPVVIVSMARAAPVVSLLPWR